MAGLALVQIHTGGFSSDEDFQQVSTGSEPTSLGLGSALRHDTALAVAQVGAVRHAAVDTVRFTAAACASSYWLRFAEQAARYHTRAA